MMKDTSPVPLPWYIKNLTQIQCKVDVSKYCDGAEEEDEEEENIVNYKPELPVNDFTSNRHDLLNNIDDHDEINDKYVEKNNDVIVDEEIPKKLNDDDLSESGDLDSSYSTAATNSVGSKASITLRAEDDDFAERTINNFMSINSDNISFK